jgi:hypothetical protein
VEQITPPVDSEGNYTLAPGEAFGPDATTWTYTAENPTDFDAGFVSGAQRLSNGNTLITDGEHGYFFEIDQNEDIVWRYVNPVTASGPLIQGEPIGDLANIVFKAHRYPPDFSGFQGRDLRPAGPIEPPKPNTTPTATPTRIASPTQPVPTTTPTPRIGDTNGDGVVNSIDALLVLQFTADLLASLPNPSAADMNRDGRVDAIDAALILQRSAGLLAGAPP